MITTDTMEETEMPVRLALVGAVGRAGMERHVELLRREQRPHFDGWGRLRNVLDVRAQLERQISESGAFRLLAYASKARGGDGRIRWIAEVDHALFYPDGRHPFVDPAHDEWGGAGHAEYPVYAEFRYAKILPTCIELEELTSWDDRLLDPQRLRSSFLFVVEPS